MSLYNHILVGADLSQTCEQIVAKAVALAQDYHAQVTLIHTIEPIPAYGYPGIADLESPIIESAKAELANIAEKFEIAPDRQIIEFGSVKQQVLKAAEDIKADLIVIGSHGRHGLSRLLGSSAAGIMHGASCDVLTIRADHD